MSSKSEAVSRLQSRNYDWAIPWSAVSLVANAEDCRLKAYQCSASVWTIGWGETEGIQPGMVWTADQADSTFNRELNKFAHQVEACLTTYASPNQLGAMTSLAYNIGINGFKKSSVLRAHNAGDNAAASRAFHLWNKARVNGALVPLAGLTARRAAESALYLAPEPGAPTEKSVQAIQSEESIVSSPIARNGMTTILAGGATGAAALFDGLKPLVEQAKEISSMLSINPLMLLAAVLIGAGVSSIYWRNKQRKDGWA